MDLSGNDAQRIGDLEDVPKAWVQLTTLDAAYIGAVETALQRKPFLRETSIHAQMPDRLPKSEVTL